MYQKRIVVDAGQNVKHLYLYTEFEQRFGQT